MSHFHRAEECSPIDNNTYKTNLNTKIKEVNKRTFHNYGYIEIKNHEILYKITNLEKTKHSKGTHCISTSSITNEKLIKFILKADKSNIITPIINQETFTINTSLNKTINKTNKTIKKFKNKKEYSKTNLCLIYQLLIRKLNDKKNMYFLRPSIYKLLIKLNKKN